MGKCQKTAVHKSVVNKKRTKKKKKYDGKSEKFSNEIKMSWHGAMTVYREFKRENLSQASIHGYGYAEDI